MRGFNNLLIGGGGIGLIEATPDLISQSSLDVSNITQNIIQLVIGIITLIGLLKKKKV